MVVGASGVIFGYLGILLTRGIVERSWWNFAVVLLVGLLYGWQLVGILPTDERISWQGHLFGLLGGVVAAILFRRRRPDAGRAVPLGVHRSPCPEPAGGTVARRVWDMLARPLPPAYRRDQHALIRERKATVRACARSMSP